MRLRPDCMFLENMGIEGAYSLIDLLSRAYAYINNE